MMSRQGSPFRLEKEEKEVESGTEVGLGRAVGKGGKLGIEASHSEKDLPGFDFTFC